ncbi:MAG: LysR family transcriptional regulator [Bdellovibrionales bacterium]|nr:LysR family transcriptional regulator [Bdellovibrionales bacterium]
MKSTLDLGHLHRNLPSQEALLALLAFESEGDVVRAAKVLGVTQPALSFQLRRLEENLGFKVFAFSGKRKVLTKTGQEFVREVKGFYRNLNQSWLRLERESQDLKAQTLKVAGRRELLLPLLSFPFPGQIEWALTSSAEAIEGLKYHRFDLAVSARTQDSGDLVAKLFFESKLKLIFPRAWVRPGSKVGHQVEVWMNHPAIVYGNHHAYLEEYLRFKKIPVERLRISRIVEDWFSVVELVRYGFGWSVVPEAWGIHTDQVVEAAIADSAPLTQKIYLYYRREDRKTPWIKSLESSNLKV